MKRMLKKIVAGMAGNESGSIIIPFALFLPVFILVMALSIDATKSYVVRSKAAGAQDAAMIASAVVPEEVLASSGFSRSDHAQKYAQLNLGDGKFLDSDVKITFTESANQMTADSRVTTSQNYFASAATDGTVELTSGRKSVVEFESSSTSSSVPTLTALVMDGSGSMGWGGRIGDLISAARSFIDITFKDVEDPKSEISQILYNHSIKWQEDFSKDMAKLIADTGRINAGGGTCAASALDAAKVYFDAKSGAEYGSHKKQILLMTDGYMCYIGQKCTELKNAGYEIVGITFGNGANQTPVRDCASPEKFFHAPDGAALEAIFKAVAITNVRARVAE